VPGILTQTGHRVIVVIAYCVFVLVVYLKPETESTRNLIAKQHTNKYKRREGKRRAQSYC